VFCFEEHLDKGITILLDHESEKLEQLRERITKQEDGIEKLRGQLKQS